MSLDGQVALVTGGARGIGRAIAERVAQDGADVAIADVRESELAEAVRAVEAHGRRALGLTVDVTDRPAVERMVDTTVRELGAVDILFNNAGIIKVHDFLDIEDEDFDRIMAVNSSKGGRDLIEWMTAKNRFPPLLLLRRYVKIVARYCEEHGHLDADVSRLDDEPGMPFDVRVLPTQFPPLEELTLWVLPSETGQSSRDCRS